MTIKLEHDYVHYLSASTIKKLVDVGHLLYRGYLNLRNVFSALPLISTTSNILNSICIAMRERLLGFLPAAAFLLARRSPTPGSPREIHLWYSGLKAVGSLSELGSL